MYCRHSLQVRHERPVGFAGLWAEYALLNHSCLPSVSLVVVRDRLLVHASRSMEAGEQLTRNYVGGAITRPLAERRAATQVVAQVVVVCMRVGGWGGGARVGVYVCMSMRACVRACDGL